MRDACGLSRKASLNRAHPFSSPSVPIFELISYAITHRLPLLAATKAAAFLRPWRPSLPPG